MRVHANALSNQNQNHTKASRQFRYSADVRARVADFFDVALVDPAKVYTVAELSAELGMSVEIVAGTVDTVACPDGRIPRADAEFIALQALPWSLVEEALADDSRAFSVPSLDRPVLVTIPLPRRIVREAEEKYARRPPDMEGYSFEDWLGVQVDFELGTAERADWSKLRPEEVGTLMTLFERCAAA
ncbi:MAG: hypothetical protein ACSLFQ_10090 [Thermoanaerobaculia bacterium]